MERVPSKVRRQSAGEVPRGDAGPAGSISGRSRTRGVTVDDGVPTQLVALQLCVDAGVDGLTPKAHVL